MLQLNIFSIIEGFGIKKLNICQYKQFYPKYGVCEAVNNWIGKTVGHG